MPHLPFASGESVGLRKTTVRTFAWGCRCAESAMEPAEQITKAIDKKRTLLLCGGSRVVFDVHDGPFEDVDDLRNVGFIESGAQRRPLQPVLMQGRCYHRNHSLWHVRIPSPVEVAAQKTFVGRAAQLAQGSES